jgi:hypothetical protein
MSQIATDASVFDPAPKSPSSLFYLPRIAKSGINFFEEQAGPVLSVEPIPAGLARIKEVASRLEVEARDLRVANARR